MKVGEIWENKSTGSKIELLFVGGNVTVYRYENEKAEHVWSTELLERKFKKVKRVKFRNVYCKENNRESLYLGQMEFDTREEAEGWAQGNEGYVRTIEWEK